MYTDMIQQHFSHKQLHRTGECERMNQDSPELQCVSIVVQTLRSGVGCGRGMADLMVGGHVRYYLEVCIRFQVRKSYRQGREPKENHHAYNHQSSAVDSPLRRGETLISRQKIRTHLL